MSVRIGADGSVREPATGVFDVTVPPGRDPTEYRYGIDDEEYECPTPGKILQAAVDRCRPGGSVLLLPGMHEGPLVLPPGKVVHVFGRGLASLHVAYGNALTSSAANSTIDGLNFRFAYPADIGEGGWGKDDEAPLVWIKSGGLRLHSCDLSCGNNEGGCPGPCLLIEGGDPVLTSCK